MRTILQVPVSNDLRVEALAASREMGFSSLQETIRVLLSKLANRQLTIQVEETVIPLSSRAEKRYSAVDKDFRTNKNVYRAGNIDDLMRHLHAN
jgi:antitoxin component of RelBE/YafQ-DinJ toxin-antitoxin module